MNTRDILILTCLILIICTTQTLQCIMTNKTLRTISEDTLKQQLVLTAMYRK